MPYVQVRTNAKWTDEQVEALKNILSPAIEIIPGKFERGVIVEFVPNCKMYMAGTDELCAYVSVAVNNEQTPENIMPYSKKVIEVLSEEGGIPKNRIYVTHQSYLDWHFARTFDL